MSVKRLPYSTLQQVVQASDYRIRMDTDSVYAESFEVRGGKSVNNPSDLTYIPDLF